MADISLSSGSIVRPYRTPWGAFAIKHMTPLSSNARIDVGRPVELLGAGSTSGGQIIPHAADNTFLLVGIAASSLAAGSSATANSPIPVWEANPMQEFVGYSFGAPMGSSIIGKRKKLTWDSTRNIALVDLSASTATDWRIVVTGLNGHNGVTGLAGESGDTGGQVTFRFLPTLAENNNSTIPSSTPLLAFFG